MWSLGASSIDPTKAEVRPPKWSFSTETHLPAPVPNAGQILEIDEESGNEVHAKSSGFHGVCLGEWFSELPRSLKMVRLLWQSRGPELFKEKISENQSPFFQIEFGPSFKLNSGKNENIAQNLIPSVKCKR